MNLQSESRPGSFPTQEVRGPKIRVNRSSGVKFLAKAANLLGEQCRSCAAFLRLFKKNRFYLVFVFAGYLCGLATLLIAHGGGEFLVEEFIKLIGMDDKVNDRIRKLEAELERRSQCFVRILDHIYECTSTTRRVIVDENNQKISGHNCTAGSFCVVDIDLIITALVVLNSGSFSEYDAQNCRISSNGFGCSLGGDICINDGTLGRNSEQNIGDTRQIIEEIDELSWTVSYPENHMKKIIDLLDFGNTVEPSRISGDIERLSLNGDLVHLDRLWEYYYSAHHTAFPEILIRQCLDRKSAGKETLRLCAD